MEINLKGTIDLSGHIVAKTGLTIGGGEGFGIGGIDKLVIRDSYNDNAPYIPGSSIKGKMRHLLELKYNKVPTDKDGKPHSCQAADCFICPIFGPHNPDDRQKKRRGPTRLIVRDAPLNRKNEQIKNYRILKGDYVEIKPENVINRYDGEAKPRRFERVPAGMQFQFRLIYRVFNVTDGSFIRNELQDIDDFKYVLEGLFLIQKDYLGSSGSRGYGRVKFKLDPYEVDALESQIEIWKNKINPIIKLYNDSLFSNSNED